MTAEEMANKLAAKRISLLREYGPHFTQRAVAGRTGVSVPTLHYWETGTQVPQKLENWHDWAEALRMKFQVSVT